MMMLRIVPDERPQRAGDDSAGRGEHEPRRRRRPARVAVSSEDDDRQVGAADRHHQVHFEDAGMTVISSRNIRPVTTSAGRTAREAAIDSAITLLSRWRPGSTAAARTAAARFAPSDD